VSHLSDLVDQSARLRIALDKCVQAGKARHVLNPTLTGSSEHGAVKAIESIDLDLLVTHAEVNDLHGTGILIKRMFPDWRRILHVWTLNAYPVNDFGMIQLFIKGWQADRHKMYATTLDALRPYQIRRILCIPFSVEDIYAAMAARDARAVPLLLYIMDDQNLSGFRIPDAVLREAMEMAGIVFVISPEMRDAYEAKFGIKCHVLPPLVRAADLATGPIPAADIKHPGTGVMLGNIWNKAWLDEIRGVTRGSGVSIHWYGNAGKFVEFDPADLARDGIIYQGALPEGEICGRIRQYAFGVLPSSPDDQEDWLAKYSIPTRLVTSVAAGNLPMIVIGSERSASSRFVRRFDLGEVCPYSTEAFQAAAGRMGSPEAQAQARANAAKHAALFSDEGIADWIWKSGEEGLPADDRFESVFVREKGSIAAWIEPPAPGGIYHGLHESYYPYRRLARLGYTPDFFVDVGASNGVFSDMIARVFPGARRILVEPLAEIYAEKNAWYFEQHPEFEIVKAALDETAGRATFHVTDDLFNSSLLNSSIMEGARAVPVEIKTLDGLARELAIEGRGLLKVDVQCAEHRVLAGGREFLDQVDGILLELSLVRFAPEAKVFDEMLGLLDSLGFRYFDECGGWRLPQDGRLVQKDVLFLRKGLLEYAA